MNKNVIDLKDAASIKQMSGSPKHYLAITCNNCVDTKSVISGELTAYVKWHQAGAGGELGKPTTGSGRGLNAMTKPINPKCVNVNGANKLPQALGVIKTGFLI